MPLRRQIWSLPKELTPHDDVTLERYIQFRFHLPNIHAELTELPGRSPRGVLEYEELYAGFKVCFRIKPTKVLV